MFLVKAPSALRICPCCGGILQYRDSRKRIRKLGGGKSEYLQIRRLFCSHCRRLHVELPDCLVPHKHYDARIIADVLDERITQDTLEYEDYPCAATMQRWIRWFEDNRANIEGFLQRAVAAAGKALSSLRCQSWLESLSTLKSIRSADHWLKVILRTVYNSGGALLASPP